MNIVIIDSEHASASLRGAAEFRGFAHAADPNFIIKNSICEVRDLFKKVRGPRGVIFPKYEPVASHGDPKSARNPEI